MSHATSVVLDVVSRLEGDDRGAHVDVVYAEVKATSDVTATNAMEAITQLIRDGEIYQPHTDVVRTV